jgi:hypothetical protein
MRGDAVELQLDMSAPIRRVEFQVAPVPADAARTVTLRHVGSGVEWPFHGPVVRQVDGAPFAVVEGRRRGAGRIAGLRMQVTGGMAAHFGHDDVARMEYPTAVQ